MTGSAYRITENKLLTGIRLAASKPVNAKVVGIIETAPIPRICDSVFKHLIRNGRWILTEVL
jgi:hypothetical protein